MEYLSPLSLIKHFVENVTSKSQLDFGKIKKKILAEFDFSDSGTITINSHELNKSEALDLLEEAKNSKDIDTYIELARFPQLESFLENEDPSFLANQNEFLANASKELIEFTTPLIAAKFSDSLKAAVKTKKYLKVKKLIAYPLILDAEFETRCFNPTHNYLNAQLGELELLLSTNIYDIDRYFRASFFWNTEFITVLNTLPDYYKDLRDKLGEYLQKLAVKLNDEFENDFMAQKLLEGAVRLKTSSAITLESKRLKKLI